MSKSVATPPSNSRVGARVRIKPEHQSAVEALFHQAMIVPIYKELREDGNVSYWFDKKQTAFLSESHVLERIPLHHWAHYAIIGSPPSLN
jgi:hypothetical protein